MATNTESIWADLSDLNAAYLLDLYDRYRADPASVDAPTRELFDRWGPPPSPNGAVAEARPVPIAAPAADPVEYARKVSGAAALATAIRAYGHQAARLDPLGTEPPGDAELLPETHGIREQDLAELPAVIIGGPLADRAGNALAAIRHLRKVYQASSGFEFEHLSNEEERFWLRSAVESGQFRPPRDPINERKLLDRLTEVGALERFLQSAFPGQTRFSLEGLGMMVPVLDEIVGAAAEAGTSCMLVGMAHRGRLNVLAHILGKPYEQIIAEFMGRFRRNLAAALGTTGEGWTGDVKYHLGARRAYRGGKEVEMHIQLVPNPSHLEWVNPVVEGMTRASDERRDVPGPPRQDELCSVAVLIHGDAAFPGQGVVAETLNLSRLPGYRTGGTIHIITNNQLGFTTSPHYDRSTLYASDLAKGFEIPVIHVNADDPEACVAAARLAHAYRNRFRKDVLIDLIGYRRWGHNEGDEPSFTQPKLYERIRNHPTVREIWAGQLVRRGLITREEADAGLRTAIEELHGIRRRLMAEKGGGDDSVPTAGLEAGGETGGIGRPGAAAEVETAVPAETLAAINEALYGGAPGFHLHPKLEKPFERRRRLLSPRDVAAGGAGPEGIEWAHAEALAFGAVLAEGTPVRLTGQDVGRGTFSQRHAILHDCAAGGVYIPLQRMPQAAASFQVWDSPLSEQATLGFEFGYSVQAPEALVVWEAQYGDFVNVPQVIIDQFVVSAWSKWEQRSGLVLLLPHGYEGQGPEHSSARLERFLQMAAEDNLRIANCTSAAQYFHVLRRQAHLLSLDPRPLVLFTPKSLLRNPKAQSPLADFTRGRFRPVIPDLRAPKDPKSVRRLVLCSGKIYYDVENARDEGRGDGVAVVRVEELYPFPAAEIAGIVESCPRLREVVWLQEEPRNMGAWPFVAPRTRDILRGRVELHYVGRTRRASPAEGSYHWHTVEQQRIISAALETGVPPIQGKLASKR